MLNPDGVIHGHYRNNILGKDLNRMWQDPRPNLTPTIYYLKKLISINKPFFFCDFHGHSNMPNCALYCCSPPKRKKNKFFNYPNSSVKSYHFYEEKVFMRIFEEEAKYYEKTGEKYSIQKSKLKSARGVIYNEFNVYFSYALETGLMTKYNKLNNINTEIILEPSTINEYYQIGTDYINSFIKWDNKSKFYAVLKKIREEEETKKTKEKEKDKEKENSGMNGGIYIKENKKENRPKKIVKINKINIGKNIKEKNNNKINIKKEKQIKDVKNTKINCNSLVILPKIFEGESKIDSILNKNLDKNENLQNKK